MPLAKKSRLVCVFLQLVASWFMWDLSSLTRDKTRALCIGRESLPSRMVTRPSGKPQKLRFKALASI